MLLYKTKAIALKGINLGESDRIINFFTRDFGKIQGVTKLARRTKSKFGAALDTLTLSQIIFFGKQNANLYKINSVDIINPFHANRESYEKLVRSLYLSDMVNTFFREHDPHPDIFDLMETTLKFIGDAPKLEKVDTAVNIFQIKFLAAAGYAPILTECVFCKNPSLNLHGFHLEKGGGVCKKCMNNASGAFYVSPGILNFMKQVTVANKKILSRLIINSKLSREIQSLIAKYMKVHIGKELRSSKFIFQS